jgi:hypothetical protein
MQKLIAEEAPGEWVLMIDDSGVQKPGTASGRRRVAVGGHPGEGWPPPGTGGGSSSVCGGGAKFLGQVTACNIG